MGLLEDAVDRLIHHPARAPEYLGDVVAVQADQVRGLDGHRGVKLILHQVAAVGQELVELLGDGIFLQLAFGAAEAHDRLIQEHHPRARGALEDVRIMEIAFGDQEHVVAEAAQMRAGPVEGFLRFLAAHEHRDHPLIALAVEPPGAFHHDRHNHGGLAEGRLELKRPVRAHEHVQRGLGLALGQRQP